MSKPLALVKFSTFFAALAFFAFLLSDAALQAKPTQAQISAIRAACRTDYRAHCSDITPGGPAALACLKKNIDSLSSACRDAVSAVGESPTDAAAPQTSTEQGAKGSESVPPAPDVKSAPAMPPPSTAAPAPTPSAAATARKPTQAQISAIRSACRQDYGTYCADVTPGGSAALMCLKKNASSLSSACRSAVDAVGGSSKSSAAPSVATPSAAAPEGGAPETAPEPSQPKSDVEPGAEPNAPEEDIQSTPRVAPFRELAIIRRFCGRDYRAFCADVPPGGGRIIGCLKDNASALSPPCKRALQQMLQP